MLRLRPMQVAYESDNDNTRRPGPQRYSASDLKKCRHFAGKFNGRSRVQESAAGVTYLSVRVHPKSYRNFT